MCRIRLQQRRCKHACINHTHCRHDEYRHTSGELKRYLMMKERGGTINMNLPSSPLIIQVSPTRSGSHLFPTILSSVILFSHPPVVRLVVGLDRVSLFNGTFRRHKRLQSKHICDLISSAFFHASIRLCRHPCIHR